MSWYQFTLALLLFVSLGTSADEAKSPPRKTLNLKPVLKQNPNEVPQLPPTQRTCYVGGEQFWIHDDVDEARCAEAGGKASSAPVSEKKVRNMKNVPTLTPPKIQEGNQRQFDPASDPTYH